MSWKTRGRNTKYSRTNTVKDKVHGKTKYSRKKNSWQFAFNILCNVFEFLFENLSLNKMYVFSNSYSMYSPSLALFLLDTNVLFCVKYQETKQCSLLQYQTPRSRLLKNKAIAEFFLISLDVFWNCSQYLYTLGLKRISI